MRSHCAQTTDLADVSFQIVKELRSHSTGATKSATTRRLLILPIPPTFAAQESLDQDSDAGTLCL